MFGWGVFVFGWGRFLLGGYLVFAAAVSLGFAHVGERNSHGLIPSPTFLHLQVLGKILPAVEEAKENGKGVVVLRLDFGTDGKLGSKVFVIVLFLLRKPRSKSKQGVAIHECILSRSISKQPAPLPSVGL